MLLPIIFGAVLGAPFVLVARRRQGHGEIRLLAVGLVVAALIYIVLALAAGADRDWLALETAGVGLFGVLAWLGLRTSLWWLAAAHEALGFEEVEVIRCFRKSLND